MDKKLKPIKETREEKQKRKMKEKREVAYGVLMRKANSQNDYIKNITNGRYFLERCNMIVAQINSGKIDEKIDGATKTMGLMRQELGLMKYQAITSMRNAHFAKKDLIEEYKLTKENILTLEEDYYVGKIIREDYDDAYKKGNKAKFVKE